MSARARAVVPAADTFRSVLDAARPKMVRMLASYRVPFDDADDLLHEALVRALTSWDQTPVERREGWLIVTLRNTILMYFREQQRERRLLALAALEVITSESAPQERRGLVLDLEALTADLSPRDRQILWLCFALELPPREAAEQLGCQPDSVRKLARRALERVRRHLNREP